jgi:hypothetical protein
MISEESSYLNRMLDEEGSNPVYSHPLAQANQQDQYMSISEFHPKFFWKRPSESKYSNPFLITLVF